jgi:hypothetical protein
MVLARITTSNPSQVQRLKRELRAAHYLVEILTPDQTPKMNADVEFLVEDLHVRDVRGIVANISDEDLESIYVASGLLRPPPRPLVHHPRKSDDVVEPKSGRVFQSTISLHCFASTLPERIKRSTGWFFAAQQSCPVTTFVALASIILGLLAILSLRGSPSTSDSQLVPVYVNQQQAPAETGTPSAELLKQDQLPRAGAIQPPTEENGAQQHWITEKQGDQSRVERVRADEAEVVVRHFGTQRQTQSRVPRTPRKVEVEGIRFSDLR